jgi:hypothetical protein
MRLCVTFFDVRLAGRSTIAGVALCREQVGGPFAMMTGELTHITLLDFEIYCVITFGACFLLTRPRIYSIAEGKNWERRETGGNCRLEKVI